MLCDSENMDFDNRAKRTHFKIHDRALIPAHFTTQVPDTNYKRAYRLPEKYQRETAISLLIEEHSSSDSLFKYSINVNLRSTFAH